LGGIDFAASYFVAYFVQGKFWTIFSLLFGMGFAVMLSRAERAGRPFMVPYLRRILALATFGAAHFIFLWAGDILFSYAVGAGALLILLHGNWKYILAAMAVTLGLGFIPGFDPFFAVTAGLGIAGLSALYLRGERLFNVFGLRLPLVALLLLVPGVLVSIAAIVLWVLPNGPKDPRIPLSVIGPLLTLVGVLAARSHPAVEKRSVRLAVTLYAIPFTVMTVFGTVQYFNTPDPAIAAVKSTQAKPGDAKAAEVKAPQAKPDAKAGVAAKDEKKPEKSEAEKVAERKAERAKRLAQRELDVKEEVRVYSKGQYIETVERRAREFPEKAAGDAANALVLIGMFLLGAWFVRSGVMEKPAQHLPFFRKLAWIGLPVGIGIGVFTSLLGVSHVPGDMGDGFQMTRGLMMLANLPACLGYVGLVVLMLHSNSVFSRIRILAPVGRMALTNYLTQSLICATYFYGYGMGHWGMPRGEQMLFVAIVYSAQIVFSHWWLSKFRYGPMEWLWRGFTYRQLPALRIDPAHDARVPAAA
jgi:uncharacterized membrane protein YeiB